MQFAQHQPAGQLASFVKTIWAASGSRDDFASAEPIVPDGCVEIIFNAGDPFADDRGTQPLDLLAGQMTAPVIAMPTGTVDLIGVRFHSARAGAALRTPMAELQDQLIAASSVLGGCGRIVDNLRNMPAGRRMGYLVSSLTACFTRLPSSLHVVDGALALIHRRRGNIAIEQVARTVGVSRRQLERLFKDEVGLGAKQIARIARVHAALDMMRRDQQASGAEIAAHCGYSDQAHLIRECKSLTGQTPARVMTSERSLAGLMREAAGVHSA